jgi:A/G-specific adenine glycosylase
MVSLSETLEENGHKVHIPQHQALLKKWGRENLREFPWRRTQDPYRVLMAEFMLLRTQAKQVVPVFREFLERYPSLDELSAASREDVGEVLRPLGLSWRADRVYETSQALRDEFDGEVPRSRESLMSLPGVSQYIAGAVRCFSYGEPEALIDTNTVRITGRLFGLEVKSSSRRNSRFQSLIHHLSDSDKPRLYNFSFLDLGAKICTSRSPDCPSCPLTKLCRHGQQVTSA